MNYLTEHHVVHRDLALRNILVSQDVDGKYVVKVGDFGMSKSGLNDDDKTGAPQQKPIRWSAPEVLMQWSHNHGSSYRKELAPQRVMCGHSEFVYGNYLAMENYLTQKCQTKK